MVEVPAVSLLWVACWSSDNAGELAACSDEGYSSPGEARPLGIQRRIGGELSEIMICQR